MARVLLVEDDALTRETLVDVLRVAGYTVSTAANGAQALDWGADWAPDVIVLDARMPVMDGYTFLRERARDPRLAEVPVVVISAAPQGERFGAVFLPKPLDIRALLDHLKRLTTREPPHP